MKRRAGGLAQLLAQVLGHQRIGQLHQLAVGEPERAHVERIALAVLGELGADDPVAPAAIVGRIIVEALERRAERAHRRRHILAHPMHDRLGEAAAQRRRRRHGDAGLVGQAARLRAAPRRRSRIRRFRRAAAARLPPPASVSRRRQADSGAISSGFGTCLGRAVAGLGRSWPRQWNLSARPRRRAQPPE